MFTKVISLFELKKKYNLGKNIYIFCRPVLISKEDHLFQIENAQIFIYLFVISLQLKILFGIKCISIQEIIKVIWCLREIHIFFKKGETFIF